MVRIPRRSRIVSVLFLAVLLAPAVVGLLSRASPDAIAAIENRAAAPWPAAPRTLADANAAPRAIDAYLEDRFGFRERLIALNRWMSDQLDLGFAESDALVGDDGWLFLASGGAQDMYMGRTPFQSGEAAAWLDASTALKKRVHDNGAVFAILIPPQKSTVYGEYLPDFIQRGEGASRLDILTEGARLRGLPFADAKGALLSRKGEAQLYYRSDTHWTARGAFEGYGALMDVLEREGVRAPRLDRDRVAFPEREFSGDLARMLGQQERFKEIAPRLSVREATPFTEQEIDAFVFDSFKTRIIETDVDGAPTLLLIGDSYSNALIPILRESFSRIVFTHHQLGAFERAVLDDYSSDVVVLQIVERMLVHPLAPEIEQEE